MVPLGAAVVASFAKEPNESEAAWEEPKVLDAPKTVEVVADEAPKVEAAPKMVSFLGGCAGGSTFSSTAALGGSSAGGVSVFASGSFSWTGGSWAAGGVVTSETSGGGVETALSRKLQLLR